MSFTIAPLHNLDLGAGARIPCGKHFVLEEIPSWLLEDKTIIGELSQHDRGLLLRSRHALVTEYEANSIGYPDPDWAGTKPRGIQSLRLDAAILANFCIWLIKPSAVFFTNAFHALTTLDNGQIAEPPLILQTQSQAPLYCHHKDADREVTGKDIIKAGELYDALSTVPRNNSLWEGMRAAWDALVTYDSDRRYPPFWLGIEALFGRDTVGNQLTRTLARRIAFFLAPDYKDAQNIHDMVIRCYEMRCKIVHGRWDNDPLLESVMYETEAILRTAIRRIAADPKLIAKFASPKRDAFLSKLVHQRGKTMPPLLDAAPAGNARTP